MVDAYTTKKDLFDLENRLNTIIPAWVTDMIREIKHHFDVVAENLHYDFKGILNDKISQHEDRILVLEKNAGIK